mgnify:CR=1 FL=1
MKRLLFIWPVLAAVLVATHVYSQSAKPVALDSPKDQKLRNVKAEQVQYKGRKALRVTDDAPPNSSDDDRFLMLTATDFKNGVIEIELAGDTMPNASVTARGFVGITFRTATDGSKFECFYLRPTNGRADDQVRRNHSTQYISHPDFPWQKLRKEFPEKYESYVDLTPGEWTKVKIEVVGTKARLYVHDASQPALIVNDLKLGESVGAIGLWVGPGTVAHFSNLRVSK